MGLARFRLGTERRSATRWIGAVLLIALAAGAAIVAAQAARRTDTAFARDLREGNASNAVVNANALGENDAGTRILRAESHRELDDLDRSSSVAAHGRFGGITVYRIVDGKVDRSLDIGSALGLVAYDDDAGRTVERLHLNAGRLSDPARADEVVITQTMAKLTGWRVGTRVTDLEEFDVDAVDFRTGEPRLDRGTVLSVVVVGVGEMPAELLQARTERAPRVFFTPAFERRFPDASYYLQELVRLRPGVDVQALRAVVDRANEAHPDVGMTVAPTDDGLRKVTQANDPLVRGLWIVALLAALVGLLLVAQSFGQSLSARADEHAQFRALGATRLQRVAIETGSLVVVAVAAAVLAALLAFLFSPFTPIGAARDAEPHPGFSLDLALTAAAVALTVLGTFIAALPALWRVINDRSLPGRGAPDAREVRSHLADAEARAGLGVPAVIGTRLAFQSGRGKSATPVRSVLASLTLVVAAVTATVAFGASLQHWTSTPRLYGWNWSAAIGQNFGAIPPEFEGTIARFPNVVAAGVLNVGTLTVNGRAIPAIGVDPFRGSVTPELNAGRLPTNTSEIVFGARTLRQLHAHVGDHVSAVVSGKRVGLTIVGTTTFPAFGNERFGETGLGTGALATAALFPVHDASVPDGHHNYMLLRFAPGTESTSQRDLRAFLAQNGCADSTCFLTDSRPAEIDGYRNARGLPLVIGVVLVLFLVATLVHALVSTMRRRTGDLVVLRALGCTRRELGATLRWQGLMLTVTALVVGVPVGLVGGRLAWNAFSSQIGIAPRNTVPLVAMAVGAVALIVIATTVAALVGRAVSPAVRRYRAAS